MKSVPSRENSKFQVLWWVCTWVFQDNMEARILGIDCLMGGMGDEVRERIRGQRL